MSTKRSGTSQIDWIMGFVFFIMIVSVSLYNLSYLSKPIQPYEAPLKSQLDDLKASIDKELTWTAYRIPLTVESTYVLENYPLSIEQRINLQTKNSTFILDKYGNILTTEVDTNNSKIFWTSDIDEGKNTFYLFYITNSSLNLSENITQNDFQIQGLKITNSQISAEFNSAGIVSLTFNTREYIKNDIVLGTANSPLIINNSIRSFAKYPKNITVTTYTNNSRIHINSSTPTDFILHLDNYLTQFYVEGTAYTFNGTNNFTGTTDFTDLYNDTGISVIGTNLDMTINDTGTIRNIHISSATNFELYLHNGSYSNMLNESSVYPGLKVLIGLPEKITGIKEEKISELEMLYYDKLTERLEIDNLGILIKIENSNV